MDPGSPDGEPVEAPRPERLEGRRDGLRGEAPEEAGDRRRAREPAKAEQLPDRDIGLQDGELGEAAGACQDTREEREDDVMRRCGIRRGQDEREHLGELRGQADPLGEGHKEGQPAKGRHGFVGEGDSDCLGAIQRGNLSLHRFVPPLLVCVAC